MCACRSMCKVFVYYVYVKVWEKRHALCILSDKFTKIKQSLALSMLLILQSFYNVYVRMYTIISIYN